MKKTLWIDIETTGIKLEGNYIIELAALYEDGNTKDVFHQYSFPPEEPKDFHIMENLLGHDYQFYLDTGLSQELLYNNFTMFLGQYIDKYNKTDKAIFAAYYAKFDNGFIRQLFKEFNDDYFGSWFYSCSLDIFSTVALALQQGVIPPLENYKNQTVAKYLGIDTGTPHFALSDIKASRQIQIKLLEELKK